jgi:CRISPR-associated protein Cst2
MAFVTGLLLIDAPASALNNLGSIPGARTDNTTGVKVIKTKEGYFPYVSAQAVRYWLRDSLSADNNWKSAPVYREEKVAYTDANPIEHWDDDLLGYMRAPGTSAAAKQKREKDLEYKKLTPLETEKDGKELGVTRVSPFRLSTFVSVGPCTPTDDFGTMARHEGDPVPYEHQFYRTTLKGLFSLDLRASGTFSYADKTGFRNLDSVRINMAKEKRLQHLKNTKEYRLTWDERVKRVGSLFNGLARLEGGAKLSTHYTDVAPVLSMLAVTKGGNHIFGHVINPDSNGRPKINLKALEEVFTVFKPEILSDVYVGWTSGYLDDQREGFKEEFVGNKKYGITVHIDHPRITLETVATALKDENNKQWMD